jgi:DNA-binding GntR family transcriptional regulator
MDPHIEPPVTTAPAKSVTRAVEVRLQLAEEIVTGQLTPGSALDESELARRFGVSRTPVREALRALAASGLVESRAHRGAVVAHPTPQRLVDMFETMAELEALCAGLAATNMTAAERRGLERLHEAMAAAMRAGEAARYRDFNETFHTTIYQGTHNAYLAEITTETRTRVQPFRRAQFGALGRIGKSHAEHDTVVAAILRGERAAAAAAMRAHIFIVRDAYGRFLEEL